MSLLQLVCVSLLFIAKTKNLMLIHVFGPTVYSGIQTTCAIGLKLVRDIFKLTKTNITCQSPCGSRMHNLQHARPALYTLGYHADNFNLFTDLYIQFLNFNMIHTLS